MHADEQRGGWIDQALSTAGSPMPQAPEDREPEAGDFVAARAGDLRPVFFEELGRRVSRHVLVLAVDRENESAWVASVTGETWYATDMDVLLSDQETGLGYDVIVQSDVTAHVLLRQLGPAFGRGVRDDLVAGIAATHRLGYPDVPPELVGAPIRRLDDPAWAWKGEGLQMVRLMSAQYLAELVFEPEAAGLVDRIAEWLAREGDKALRTRAVAFIDPEEPDVSVWRPSSREEPHIPRPGAWPNPVQALYRELGARMHDAAALLFTGGEQRLTPLTQPCAGAYELPIESLDPHLADILDSTVDIHEHDDVVEVLVGVRTNPAWRDKRVSLKKLRLTLLVSTTGGVIAAPLRQKAGTVDIARPFGAMRTYSARLPITADRLKALEPELTVVMRRLDVE